MFRVDAVNIFTAKEGVEGNLRLEDCRPFKKTLIVKNALDLEPNVIIGDDYEGFLILDAWKGFESRQGPYGSTDKDEKSIGRVKVTIEGVQVDYVKVCSPAQVAAIHYLVEHSENIKDSLLQGLLLKFPSWKEIYEEALPDVSDVNILKDLIGLSYLHVMSAEKEGYAYVGFEFGCAWDEEHGTGIMMHKERVIEIGQADTSFDSWSAYEDNGTTEVEREKWDKANAKTITEARKRAIKTKPWWKIW